MDRAYKFSVLVEKSLKVDYTPPASVTGLTLYTVDVTQPDGTQVVEVSAAWSPTSDAQSGIQHYYFHDSGMGPQSSVTNWVDNGLLCSCHNCYTFQPDHLFTFGVVAVNRAGLRSTASTMFIAPAKPIGVARKGEDLLFTSVSGKRLVVRSDDPSRAGSEGVMRYALFDMAGRLLKEGDFISDVTVDVADLSRGIYLFRISKGKEVLKTEKIVIPD